MNKTLLLQVHWHVILAASTCFALFAFFIGRAGLKWPMAPALFCMSQAIFSIPFFLRYYPEVKWAETDPKWIVVAAAIGFTGFLFFTHELGRINSMGEDGDKIRGTTIASMIALEATLVTLYHFWDVRKTTEKISMVNIMGILLIALGILCLFKRNQSQKNPVPVALVAEEMAMAGE